MTLVLFYVVDGVFVRGGGGDGVVSGVDTLLLLLLPVLLFPLCC